MDEQRVSGEEWWYEWMSTIMEFMEGEFSTNLSLGSRGKRDGDEEIQE